MIKLSSLVIITKMAKIIFLGTAASIPTSERDNTSFIFSHKKEMFLIDVPGSVVHKLSKINIDFRKIDKIIITHSHIDHFYGLIHLIHARAYTDKDITLFTHKKVYIKIRKIISILNLQRKRFPKIKFVDVFQKEFFYQSPTLKIKAVKNKHKEDSFGIKIFFSKKTLLYSSDTAITQNIIKQAEDATYLIHECTASSEFFHKYPSLYKLHTSAQQLPEVFKNTKIKKIIPIHFLLLTPKEEGKILKELAKLKDNLIIPDDFLQIKL